MRRSDVFQSKKRYAIPWILIGIVGGASWAFHSGNYLLMIALILSGAGVLYFYKYRKEQGLRDERIQHIYYLTSWATLQFSILFLALAGAFLIFMQDFYPEYTPLGFHLAYISCGIFLLYTLSHIYFNKKYGA